jgi:hypothetical protein
MADAGQQANTLMARLPDEGQFNLYLQRASHWEQYRFGYQPDGGQAPEWGWNTLDN